MKHFKPAVSVAASDMRRAVAFASTVIDRYYTIPVLGTVKIDVTADRITVTGNDLDIEAVTWCEASTDTAPFSFTISPRLLSQIIRFATGPVQISKGDKDLLMIRADDVTATFRCLCPAEDFPDFVWGDAEPSAVISEAQLHKTLGIVAGTVSTEETRYYLNGAYFTPIEGKLRLVSTDGHRMSIYDTGEDWASPSLILPTKAMQTLLRAMNAKGNRLITVEAGYQIIGRKIMGQAEDAPASELRRIGFSCEDWRIRAKVIDGNFPDYTRAIPSPSENIEATLTLSALLRFPQATERVRGIRIDPDAGLMTYRTPDEIEVSMPVTGHGGPFGLNLNYLIGFARKLGTFKLTGSTSGDPFRVLGEDPNLLQIIMPMRV